jgi:hypothetical protein
MRTGWAGWMAATGGGGIRWVRVMGGGGRDIRKEGTDKGTMGFSRYFNFRYLHRESQSPSSCSSFSSSS